MHLPGHVLPRFPRVSKHDTRKLGPISNADWTFPMCSEAEAAASARKTAQNKTIMEECMERKKRTTCLVLPSKLQLDDDFVDLPANGEEYSSRVSTQRGFPSNAQPSQESRSTIQSARVRVARRLPALRTSSPPAARPASLPRSASHATAGCGASAPAPIPGRGESRGGAGMVKRANAFAQHLHSPHSGATEAHGRMVSHLHPLFRTAERRVRTPFSCHAHTECAATFPWGRLTALVSRAATPANPTLLYPRAATSVRQPRPSGEVAGRSVQQPRWLQDGAPGGLPAPSTEGTYGMYGRINTDVEIASPSRPPHRPPHYAPHTMPHGVTASSGQKRGDVEIVNDLQDAAGSLYLVLGP